MGSWIAPREITVDGRRVSYLLAGSPGSASRPARTIVFLHAWPLCAEMWQAQLEALPAGWQAVAPDFRGFGESSPDITDGPRRDDVELADYADDVCAVLDAIGVRQAVFCGLSMGGYTLFALARRYPARVDGLILADTRAAADTAQGLEARRAMLATLDSRGVPGVASEMLPRLTGLTTQRTKPGFALLPARLMRTATPSGIGHAVIRMMRRHDATAMLAGITWPTLVVVGGEDVLTPVAESEAMRAAIAGARLVVIPEAGHLSNLEQPALFNDALCSFLAANWGAAAR